MNHKSTHHASVSGSRSAVVESEVEHLKAELARVTAEFVEIIERIDHRCSAIDGPIPPTLQEATTEELRRLWNLAHEIKAITGGET